MIRIFDYFCVCLSSGPSLFHGDSITGDADSIRASLIQSNSVTGDVGSTPRLASFKVTLLLVT